MNPVKQFDILHEQTDKIFLIEFYQLLTTTTTLQINTIPTYSYRVVSRVGAI